MVKKQQKPEAKAKSENEEEKNISNVIIVHGANKDEESAKERGAENMRHWHPWLKRELEKKKIKVSGELYPKDWNPDYEQWKKLFEKNKIDENTILVGHSLGCGFIVRWLNEAKKNVRKIILVAPYLLKTKDYPGLDNLVNFELKLAKEFYQDKLIVFYSDNDSPFILKSVSFLKDHLNGNFREFRHAGHFCKRDGFDKFPELLSEIIGDKEKKTGEENKTDFAAIEKKWQKEWEEKKIFGVKDFEKGKEKCYVLEMYPYPSASFLHMGHVRNFTIGDVFARFKRMKGFNVLYPMGYDSFGLPAETAAKKNGIHPRIYTEDSIKKISEYFKALGNSYDWTRTLASHEPEYYRWNQYFFLKLFEKGLAYRKKAPVNWCEKCQSVLANEEAEGGKCWRCGEEVMQKETEQWFFKITDYADRLLNDLDKIDWPEKIKTMQRNWIGKSEGTEVLFEINGKKWLIFTTRADTIFGVTFMIIAAKHPDLMKIVTKENKKNIEEFVKRCQIAKTPEEVENLDKDGVFTGSYAINPLTNEKIPVWAGNFVVADYGSGMVMAVPTHDQRDFDFAKKYNIPMKVVIEDKTKIITIPKSLKPQFYKDIEKFAKIVNKNGLTYIYTEKIDEVFDIAKNNFIGNPWYIHSEGKIKRILIHSEKENKIFDWANNTGIKEAKEFGLKIKINKEQLDFDELREAFTEEGTLVNSGKFNGLNNKIAIEEITKELEKKKLGKNIVNYKIRDWMISRQRYWGTPIPIIYCDKCGIVPVNEKDLPVLLPEKVDFKTAGNPLATSKEFVNAKCPKCGGKGKRETDTMGGFVDSSWYFLRYCDNKNKTKPFDEKKVNYWMPVDQYIGGAEHAVMHLIYARFFVKALKDMGFVKFDEPFSKLFNQGIVYKDGAKMSKSKGNVVFQTDISDKYGIDTARLFLMFVSSPDKQMEWSDEGVEGSFRIINRLIRLMEKTSDKTNDIQEHKINKAIKNVTLSIETFDYPKAIISAVECMELGESISRKNYEIILRLIHPFCPHITEELWHKLGNKTFLSLETWPKADENKIDEKLELAEKSIDKTVGDIVNVLNIIKQKTGKEGNKIYLYVIPNELGNYNAESISKRIGKEVRIFAVNDKAKYDPEGKAGKTKPGKPGIYIE